ncbi:MAG: hypothetical protein RI947_1199, partial [Candidatus Parcubacteria bacterium]
MKQPLTFQVQGMHCDSCELLIKDELSEVQGVSDIQIDHKTGKGSLILDSAATQDSVITAISKAGYQATIDGQPKSNGIAVHVDDNVHVIQETVIPNKPIRILLELKLQSNTDQSVYINQPVPAAQVIETAHTTQQKINLALYGMHCSSCAAIIEKSLKKVPGVKEAHVNFAAEKAAILYNDSNTTTQDLVNAVQKAGYRASIVDQKDTGFETRKRTEEINAQFRNFLISFVLSVPMLYFMLFDFFSWMPLRSQLLSYMGIISFILATPVQFFIGKGFYKGMWSALRMGTFNMDSLIAIGTSVAYFYSVINFVNYYILN